MNSDEFISSRSYSQKKKGPTIAKDINRMRVYREIKSRRRTTRAELSRLLDLNKATVNSIVDEWQQAGFIRDLGQAVSSGLGRKAVVIEFVADNRLALGFQVSRDMLHVALTNMYAEPLQQLSEPLLWSTPESIVDAIVRAVDKLDPTYDRSLIVGAGVGIPGLLNRDRSIIVHSAHLGWRAIPFGELLVKAFAENSMTYPVALDNNVKLASLGELWHGEGQGFDPFVYCNFGIGIGCSMIINGSILRGETNAAGEMGHFSVEPEGSLCRCGNRGCLVTVAGMAAIEERIGTAALNRLLDQDEKTAEELKAELERIGTAIGVALSGLINLINPGLIVCDGPLIRLSDWLFPIMRRTMEKHAVHFSRDTARLSRSRLYPYAGSLGAAASVIEARENIMAAPM